MGANRSITHLAISVMGRMEWLKEFGFVIPRQVVPFGVRCDKPREKRTGNGKERT
jgi:hypothetical protein